METEPNTSREGSSAPIRKTRLQWWLGIYFLGVLCHPNAILAFFLFPLGLEDDYESIFRWVSNFFGIGPIRNISSTLFLLVALAYGTYLIHFILTWNANRRRAFLLLMLSLILIVSGNVVGCHNMDIEHAKHPFQN
jgi:hypothetical protein